MCTILMMFASFWDDAPSLSYLARVAINPSHFQAYTGIYGTCTGWFLIVLCLFSPEDEKGLTKSLSLLKEDPEIF